MPKMKIQLLPLLSLQLEIFFPWNIWKISTFNFLHIPNHLIEKDFFYQLWLKEKTENMLDLQIKKLHEERQIKNLNPGLCLIFSKYRQICLELCLQNPAKSCNICPSFCKFFFVLLTVHLITHRVLTKEMQW